MPRNIHNYYTVHSETNVHSHRTYIIRRNACSASAGEGPAHTGTRHTDGSSYGIEHTTILKRTFILYIVTVFIHWWYLKLHFITC